MEHDHRTGGAPPARRDVLARVRRGELSAERAAELLAGPSAPAPEAEAAAGGASEAMRRGMERRVAAIVAAEARIPLSRVVPDEPFERYGFDSVMALNVTRVLQSELGDLSPTLLFEHQTVAELAAFLVATRGPQVVRQLAGGVAAGGGAAAVPMDVPATAAPPAVPPATTIGRRAAPRVRSGGGDEEKVAVVGLACRFPQAGDLAAFWANLAAGRDSITEVPAERWDAAATFDPRPGEPGKSYSKWGGFLSDIDAFDAAFFHISPREAERMDPQERLFLEEVWHALEDGGFTRASLAERTVGVYVGVMYSQYQLLAAEEACRGNPLFLGSSYASIANRVSYSFDFRGPSLALDSMCSSSLTAIHLACEALRRGDLDLAIAGGVNLTLHPAKHVDLSQGRFASTDGRCRSFGSGGDGYVPGEGVGVAILKPLTAALRDGDRVHGVLRGSSINHGGKTNGYAVPNPKAQARVIAEALGRAGVQAGEVGYLEAHGTGTALGDPIEIAALESVFGRRETGAERCSIGSVKSNIGHLESAAGIAGLAKVLLQMRQGELVPSLHSRELNPHIDFAASAFHVQQEREPWRRPASGEGADRRELPRIAGISSFGAGGANAHLVVEEHVVEERVGGENGGEENAAETADGAIGEATGAAAGAHLLVLSARDEERLLAVARELLRHLESTGPGAMGERAFLAAVCHTLQVGREPLEERLALPVSGLDELRAALGDVAAGGEPAGLIRGRAEDGGAASLSGLLRGGPGGTFLRDLFAAGDLERLGRLWVRGVDLDWPRAPGVPRVGLPGYPFARTRHWPRTVGVAAGRPALHPLIGRNVSSLREQRFVTTLRGDEPHLRDHRVAGRRVLSGAAILEMARAAGALSGLGRLAGGGRVDLEDVSWEVPVVVEGGAVDVSIALVPDGERVGWRVTTGGDDGDGDRGVVTHARGALVERGEEPEGAGAASPERLDVAALAAACDRSLEGDECYRRFAALGLAHGPSFQTLERLDFGGGLALARVRPASGGERRADGVALPPELLDGALQSLVAFFGDEADPVLRVPAKVARVEVLAALPDTLLVHVTARWPASGDAPGAPAELYDLVLAGEDGRVVARLLGLEVRRASGWRAGEGAAAGAGGAVAGPAGAADVAPLALRPRWADREAATPVPFASLGGDVLHFAADDEAAASFRAEVERRGLAVRVTAVLPGSDLSCDGDRWTISPTDPAHYERLIEALSPERFAPRAIVHAWSRAGVPAPETQPGAAADAERLAAMLRHGVESTFHLTRALLRRRTAGGVRLVALHAAGDGGRGATAEPAFAALAAFHRTVAREAPDLAFTLVDTAGAGSPGREVAALALDELAAPDRGGTEVRYRGGRRQVRELVEVAAGPAPAAAAAAFRDSGAYLLTGGLGGVGRMFARFLARRFAARLALVGRSPLDAEGAAFLDELAALGGTAIHLQGDVSRLADAERLVAETKRRLGGLHGVLHFAGVLRDGLLLGKSWQDAEAVLAPKVWGTWSLDRATRDEPLDLFALASSATAWMGTVGQSDYAYANAFLDAFASRREEARQAGGRRGRSLSIGWPLWADGGMGIDAAAERWIEEELGWVPLPAAVGIDLFAEALASGDGERAVFYGHRPKILAALRGVSAATGGGALETPVAPPVATALTAGAAAGMREHLRQAVAAELKMPPADLDPGRRLEHLGLESVMVMNLTRSLEEVFGELPTTLFFEYQTLAELADHLLERHPQRVAARFGEAAEAPAATAGATAATAAAAVDRARPAARHRRRFLPPEGSPGPHAAAADDIAIVGLAGRYPMADDVAELWANLVAGRDCITEVPAERWDHAAFFDPAGRKAGKSYSRWGGFLTDFDRFDPLFFNISPREARAMDPQERLFLQTAWAALEDAGHAPKSWAGARVGVFVGVMYAQYQLYGAEPEMQRRGFVPSSLSSSVANRVSYALDLRGPSLAIDTMCSSSLTAIHLACSSLRDGDCEAALAGGVNLTLHPNKYLQLSQGRFASTDGRCRSFGEGGDGYVPGEGVGAVLLKPLSRARRDGDHLYAVIRGSAVNHGGRTNGYSVPTPVAQHEVVVRALERAGVEPEEVGYVEAHGTGTSLGDPIEIAGLERAWGDDRRVACPIGSIKSNIGHLEAAAGIAGVTKVLLQMRHGRLVPSLHAERLNPNIRFAGGPFAVQRELAAWPRRRSGERDLPRVATVSSFGAGGSNAHLVLAEAVAADGPDRQAAPRVPRLFVLSAKSEGQLRSLAGSLAAAVVEPPAGDEPRIAQPAEADGPLAAVVAAAAEILGVAPGDVDAGDDVEDLGLDPTQLGELAEAVRRRSGSDGDAGSLAGCRSLREIARRLGGEAPPPPDEGPPLDGVAFTLQVGREELEERLAVVAADRHELAAELRRFARGEPAGALRGTAVGERPPAPGELATGVQLPPADAAVAAAAGAGELLELARRWVGGGQVDWAGLHQDRRPQRVSLPTYPFARHRYWLLDGVDDQDEATPLNEAAPPNDTAPPNHAGPPNDPVLPRASDAAAVGAAAEEGRRVVPSGVSAASAMPAAASPTAVAPAAAPSAAVPSAQGLAVARAAIVAAMSRVLEIDAAEFDLDVPHSDLGVDSVLAVEIVDRINRELAIDLKPTDFFNFSTLRKLADHVAEEALGATPAPPAAATLPAPPREPAAGGPSAADDELIALLRSLERGEIGARQADRRLAGEPRP